MTLPTFAAAGTGAATTGTSFNVGYPATVNNLDIAICQVGIRGSYAAPTFPGTFTGVGADQIAGTTQGQAWAWRRCDGTESGGSISVSGLPGGGVACYGRIYTYAGCVTTGNPYEAQTVTSANASTTYSSSAIVTLGIDRLLLALTYISDDDKTLAGLTGSNVTFVLQPTPFASGSGNDGTLAVNQADVAAITSVTAGSESYSGAEAWMTHTFALIPAVTYQPRYGYVNYVDPGVL